MKVFDNPRPLDPPRGKECPRSLTGYHNLQFTRIVNDHTQESQWVCKNCFTIVNKRALKESHCSSEVKQP